MNGLSRPPMAYHFAILHDFSDTRDEMPQQRHEQRPLAWYTLDRRPLTDGAWRVRCHDNLCPARASGCANLGA